MISLAIRRASMQFAGVLGMRLRALGFLRTLPSGLEVVATRVAWS